LQVISSLSRKKSIIGGMNCCWAIHRHHSRGA